LAADDATGGSFQTTLSFADGSLMLEDAHTAVAVIDPLARFGPSAFGPIHLRPVTADGTAGDWVPLGTLVRLPGFTAGAASKDLRCPHNPAKPCQLSGTNLFLITQVATAPDMSNAVDVPPDFTGNALTIANLPRNGVNGTSGTIYLRLRDDPDTIQTLNLPITAPASTGTLAATDPSTSPAAAPALNPSASSSASPAPAATSDASAPAASLDAPAPDATAKPAPKADSGQAPASTPNL
jgi:hypothetical protein